LKNSKEENLEKKFYRIFSDDKPDISLSAARKIKFSRLELSNFECLP
jgi:hypothetical protein